MSIASLRESANLLGTFSPSSDLILCLDSPMRIISLTFSSTNFLRGSKLTPLSLPPAISIIGEAMLSSALTVAAGLVDLESL